MSGWVAAGWGAWVSLLSGVSRSAILDWRKNHHIPEERVVIIFAAVLFAVFFVLTAIWLAVRS